ncbi:hypothetical protein KCP74_00615 [Salmonella enterica subsp. enterica]|nr:hypothetical protein KCP74_00615 [Salmonella enterica subsp. enterica]
MEQPQLAVECCRRHRGVAARGAAPWRKRARAVFIPDATNASLRSQSRYRTYLWRHAFCT